MLTMGEGVQSATSLGVQKPTWPDGLNEDLPRTHTHTIEIDLIHMISICFDIVFKWLRAVL